MTGGPPSGGFPLSEPQPRSSWAKFGSASVLFESMLPDGRLTYML